MIYREIFQVFYDREKKKRVVSCSLKYLIKEETFKYGLDHFTVYLPLCLLILSIDC